MFLRAAALVVVVAGALACGGAPTTQQAPAVSAVTPAPAASSSLPAGGDPVLNDLLGVEATAKRLTAENYTPDVSSWRRALGGSERPSQTVKASDVFKTVYAKEMRRAAHKHGLSYEDAVALVERHRASQPSAR